MKIVRDVAGMRAASRAWHQGGLKVGFVPTMGALHAGHLELVRRARACCDVVVVSIYVNPLQFGPREDFQNYPRGEAADAAACEAAGVDLLFIPDEGVMYRQDHSVVIEEGRLSLGLCGEFRPGHFSGVLTVVAKLFHLVAPTVAVFGRKDAQQAALVRRMVRDLDMDLEILVVPIVREPDGLAMSSRNRYLSSEERGRALLLSRALRMVGAQFEEGVREVAALLAVGRGVLASAPGVLVQYVAVVDVDTLEPLVLVDRPALCAVAVTIGRTRLIDNAVLDPTAGGLVCL